jgi:hypothetical protein
MPGMTALPPMQVDAQNFERMRAWFASIVPEAFPTALLSPETDPLRCLDALAARSPERVDELLKSNGLPSLTEIRIRFSKLVRRVVTRGYIKNDVEYYAVRNAAELADEGSLWKLISAYEARAAR